MTRNPGRLAGSLVAITVWAICAGNAEAAPPKGKAAATVNGEAITFAQLEPLLKNIGPLPAGLPDAMRKEMQREALALLIDEMLMTQFLRKHVPPATKAEVDQKMAELVAGLQVSKKSLAEFCKETNQTEAQIRENLGQVLQWAAYARKAVTDADAANYYANCRDFFDRVTVRASHIVLRVPQTASPGDRTAARARLLAIRNEIVAGRADFAAAAKAYSHCQSAQKGGDIGTFPRKFVVDENFARAAFALKPGEISDIVETELGLHIIKVTERNAAGPPSDFNKIKNEVKEFYAEEMRQNILAGLRKQATIEIHLP